MSCTECKYAPRSYEEYCIAQDNPGEYCHDAFTALAHLCKCYGAEEPQNKPKVLESEDTDD